MTKIHSRWGARLLSVVVAGATGCAEIGPGGREDDVQIGMPEVGLDDVVAAVAFDLDLSALTPAVALPDARPGDLVVVNPELPGVPDVSLVVPDVGHSAFALIDTSDDIVIEVENVAGLVTVGELEVPEMPNVALPAVEGDILQYIDVPDPSLGVPALPPVSIAVPQVPGVVTVVLDMVHEQDLEVAVSNPGAGNIYVTDLSTGSERSGGGSPTDATRACDSPGSCASDAYRLDGFRWNKPLRWWWNTKYMPAGAGLTREVVENALWSAANGIAIARNGCNRADHVSAEHQYLGRVSLAEYLDGEAACQQVDGKNVVSFASLPEDTLGLSCTYSEPGPDNIADETDIFLRSAERWHSVGSGYACDDAYNIEAIATHEFGHSFGLGHVSECHHPELTMSTRTAKCDSSERTLGWGDLRGLEALY